MATTKSAVISRAATQLGKYYPGDSPYGIWYGDLVKNSVYDNAQFCAMGLSWCFAKEDALDIFPLHAYTPSGAQWFKNKGRWHSGSINDIKRGDILYMNFPGAPDRISHVGIAEKDGANGRVQTIEFNTSSTAAGSQRNGRTVARKIRTGYIVGWGRPDYKSVPAWKGAMGIKKIRPGDYGQDVKIWQQFLKEEGYNLGPAGVDSKFGDYVEKATKSFQGSKGLEKDAVVGKDTQNAAKKERNSSGSAGFEKPEKPSKPKTPNCRALQRAVRTEDDNRWGDDTDKHFEALIAASNFGGNKFPHGVKFAQEVVGTKQDGSWKAKSRLAHDKTVKDVQKALKAMGYFKGTVSGIWNSATNTAYKRARKDCHI